jgi:hypothetical protein
VTVIARALIVRSAPTKLRLVVGAQSQRTLTDRVAADVFASRTAQATRETVAECQRTARDLIGQGRVRIAIGFRLRIGSDRVRSRIDGQVRADEAQVVVGVKANVP